MQKLARAGCENTGMAGKRGRNNDSTLNPQPQSARVNGLPPPTQPHAGDTAIPMAAISRMPQHTRETDAAMGPNHDTNAAQTEQTRHKKQVAALKRY